MAAVAFAVDPPEKYPFGQFPASLKAMMSRLRGSAIQTQLPLHPPARPLPNSQRLQTLSLAGFIGYQLMKAVNRPGYPFTSV